MAITQAMNSKANVKKNTSNDLPFSPAQPVLNKYEATSTAAQTTISLPFSVDTTIPEQFMLYIDGKLLRQGASNDYVFAAIDANSLSSQITLNAAIIANLNIQAYKLGLKKESEFGTDNRFVQMYEANDRGFQSFINTGTLMTATTSPGTPAAGTFYSQINNRAAMMDLSQDLRPRIGLERIRISQLFDIQNESGPANERVQGVLNDPYNQIRFVGEWDSQTTARGITIISSNAATGGFIEVVFYGTGINLMVDTGVDNIIRATVDGGTEGADFHTTGASIIQQRNYTANQSIRAVSGLTLGVHTVKLRYDPSSGNSINVYGIEILNESNNVITNPGISYVQGKKLTLSAQSSVSYSTGVTGTRGGRMLIYQNADGTIGRAFQAVNASQQNLTAADHTNEELVRQYHGREFGANRSDDFQTLNDTGPASNRHFTLDDGATNLSGDNVDAGNSLTNQSAYLRATGGFLTITFVGTGLDILRLDNGTGSTTLNVDVDGVSIGTLNTTGVPYQRVEKIVSGLPYGSHTVQISRAAGAAYSTSLIWRVYQPKKPTLPAGAIELADYNVVANYVATSGTQTRNNISQGVIRKFAEREIVYVGTWGGGVSSVATDPGGFIVRSSTNSDYFEYIFYGTGVEIVGRSSVNPGTTSQIRIDGALYTGAATALNGTSGNTLANWNAGTSTYTADTGYGAKLQISGLSLGWHTLRVTGTSWANTFQLNGLDVIGGIHANKSNLPFDMTNNLPVGNCTITDLRKTSPIKNTDLQPKVVAKARGIVSGPTTSTNSYVPLPDMTLIITSKGAWFKLSAALSIQGGAGGGPDLAFYVNGNRIPSDGDAAHSISNNLIPMALEQLVYLAPGTHNVAIYWNASGAGTITASGTRRSMVVTEI